MHQHQHNTRAFSPRRLDLLAEALQMLDEVPFPTDRERHLAELEQVDEMVENLYRCRRALSVEDERFLLGQRGHTVGTVLGRRFRHVRIMCGVLREMNRQLGKSREIRDRLGWDTLPALHRERIGTWIDFTRVYFGVGVRAFFRSEFADYLIRDGINNLAEVARVTCPSKPFLMQP